MHSNRLARLMDESEIRLINACKMALESRTYDSCRIYGGRHNAHTRRPTVCTTSRIITHHSQTLALAQALAHLHAVVYCLMEVHSVMEESQPRAGHIGSENLSFLTLCGCLVRASYTHEIDLAPTSRPIRTRAPATCSAFQQLLLWLYVSGLQGQ